MRATRPIGPSNAARLVSTAIALAVGSGASLAYDVNDKLSINLLVAGAGQCQQVAGADGENICRGALPAQPSLTWNPTKQDQVFVKLGFAAGNGLNDTGPFVLAPWAADLEDDTKNINGRDYNYLFEAWYAHTFQLAADNSIRLVGGIVDSTSYLNQNAYAADEYTQFTNEVFVNARSADLPSYDQGGAIIWSIKDLTFSAVAMNVGENADGNNYNYFAGEIAYRLSTQLGEGNYRVMYSETSREFLDPTGQNLEHREGWYLSFDQALGKHFGAFVRMGWQSDNPLIEYESEYSGGFNISGSLWGREKDNIGIGFAYLQGPNWGPQIDSHAADTVEEVAPDDDVDTGNDEPLVVETDTGADIAQVLARTNVFETYYRFVVNDYLAVTADVQYMQDKYRQGGEDVDGWIFGLRAVVEL